MHRAHILSRALRSPYPRSAPTARCVRWCSPHAFAVPICIAQSSIWGLSKQGKTCKACGISVHAKCELKVSQHARYSGQTTGLNHPKVPANCGAPKGGHGLHAHPSISSSLSRSDSRGESCLILIAALAHLRGQLPALRLFRPQLRRRSRRSIELLFSPRRPTPLLVLSSISRRPRHSSFRRQVRFFALGVFGVFPDASLFFQRALSCIS